MEKIMPYHVPQKMKQLKHRILSLFIALILLFQFPVSAFAAEEPTVSCQAAAAVDLDTGTLLFEKNAQERVFPASTTKVITALIILENRDLSDTIEVGSEIREGGITTNSSLMYLEKGDKITVEELLYGLMLVSGNDAAATLAVSTAGSISAFADMMNEKAQELGMTNTHFVTPHGIHNEEHYSTAEDMAKLTVAAMQNETFRRIVSTKTHDSVKINSKGTTVTTELRNTNNLLHTLDKNGNANPYYYAGTTGIKTGYTIYAKYCLISSAERNGRHVAALLFADGSENSGAQRWKDAAAILDYALNNYENYSLAALAAKAEITLNVWHAAEKDSEGGLLSCDFGDLEDKKYSLPKDLDTSSGITAEPSFNQGIMAPLFTGDEVGTAKLLLNGEVIYEGAVYASRDVYEEGFETAANGPVTIIDQLQVEEINLEVDEEETKLMLWWLLLPAALLIYLIVRYFTIRPAMRKKYLKRTRRR